MLTEQEASPTIQDAILALLVEMNMLPQYVPKSSRERNVSRNKARTTSYKLMAASRYMRPKEVVGASASSPHLFLRISLENNMLHVVHLYD